MSESFDIAIIGAGPAGMAAAQICVSHGAKTLLLDEQSSPGGQIFRAIETAGSGERPELGKAYHDGSELVRAFRNSAVTYIPNASVWQLSKDREIAYSRHGSSQTVRAKQIIIASGAQERPMPVSGWTLPGVMTMGAAQILLKESEVVIEDAIFAGTGPLFYLVIWQYLQAGIPIKAAIDLTPKANYRRALVKLPHALPGVSKLYEGWRWKREIIKSEVPYVSNVEDIRITGEHRATGIEYLQGKHWKHMQSEHILLHQGVVPNLNLSLSAGCDSSWNEEQACWTVDVNPWFQSSIPGIAIAGDGATVRGGTAAALCGRIAALNSLAQISKISTRDRDQLAKPYQSTLKSEMYLRPFLNRLFRPAEQFRIPQQDKTVVCRCEEITRADILEAIQTGCTDPNQLKSYNRCGMGPCQGRFCGLTVSELTASITGKSVSDVGYYRLRPPVKPLLLSELANLNRTREEPEDE